MIVDTHEAWLAEGDRFQDRLDCRTSVKEDEFIELYEKMVERYESVAATPAADIRDLAAQLKLIEREVVRNDTIPSWGKIAIQSVLTTLAREPEILGRIGRASVERTR